MGPGPFLLRFYNSQPGLPEVSGEGQEVWKSLEPRHTLFPSPVPTLRRQHHLRSALEAFLRQRDLEAAFRALTLGGWMAHYFQSRAPRQEAALKTHVREPMPQPALLCALSI